MSRNYVSIILLFSLAVSLVALGGCGKKATTNGGDGTNNHAGARPQLILFTQPGCTPCVPAESLVEELEKEYEGKVDFKVIDVSTDFELAQEYRIQYTPTIIILDSNGALAQTFVGPPEKAELKATLEGVLPE